MKTMFCVQVLGRSHSHIHSNDLHGVMGSGESRKRCNEHSRPSGPLILPGESVAFGLSSPRFHVVPALGLTGMHAC